MMPLFLYGGQLHDEDDYTLASTLVGFGYDWAFLATRTHDQLAALVQYEQREVQKMLRRLEFYRLEFLAGRLHEGVRYTHASA